MQHAGMNARDLIARGSHWQHLSLSVSSRDRRSA